jgi:hypothetical protein
MATMDNKVGQTADQASKVGKNVLNKTTNKAESLFSDVPEILHSITDLGKSFVDGMKGSGDKAITNLTSSLKSMERSAQKKPWVFMLSAAITGVAIGYMLGHRRPISDEVKKDLDLDSIH